MEIQFTLPIAPMSLQSSGKRLVVVGGRPRFFKNAAATKYQNAIRMLAMCYRPKKPLVGPITVDFTFILPRPARLNRKGDCDGWIPCDARPDRDNLQKGTQDALSDFWEDDGQIFAGKTEKFYAEKNGSARIIVGIHSA